MWEYLLKVDSCNHFDPSKGANVFQMQQIESFDLYKVKNKLCRLVQGQIGQYDLLTLTYNLVNAEAVNKV